ncbi:TRAP-type C4-dicarboxylate transport system substrate-binding protein [Breoghania corrubedonensis]|uniref:TRAP-type C4-dicarboxylate transport system substrate-binding protein n=1 Tax=Breoghania corrubedonensis TaxID=665038 RepID=A0A2T5V6D8_9HYPH|nr:TRAP transporter substrate-binding protein [Breoghania corrubedonensis]PTW59312.1 TRAP-type C4-dicarboxylate transport system substrate-binding protein [Breoghania corrubedonensis]
MKRLLTSAVLALAVAVPASAQTTQFKVLGQPTSIGKIFDELEKPFFEDFAKSTGLDVSANYNPVDTTGIKDAEGLRMVKSGLFDIVSLRFSPISRDAPIALGIDLVGQNPDYKSAKQSTELFLPEVKKVFEASFNTKLLGVWPFGPQVLFCKPEVASLTGLKGKKVRVFDQSMANFVDSLGGTPVPMAFPEVQQALQRGVIDCALTGPSSANAAGWPEVATTVIPVGFSMAFNGYGMNLDRWNTLSADQQAAMQAAFDTLDAKIWKRSEELYDEAMRCNSGGEPCSLKSYSLKVMKPGKADFDAVKKALAANSFPAWQKICDASTEGCSAAWMKTVGKAKGL